MRGGGEARCRRRAEEDCDGPTRLRRHLQAAKPRVVERSTSPLGPEKHRAARAGTQCLLGGPERILVARGLDDEAASERHAGWRERRSIGKVRRIDPRDEARVFGGLGEHRGEQLHFADAHFVMQHFGK